MHGIVVGAYVSRMFQMSDVEPLVFCVRSKELIEHRKQIYRNAIKKSSRACGSAGS
jgi:hypothetical protein